MNREEIIQILSKYAVDLFAHGLRYGYETNTPLLEKIADEIVSFLPPAEGAEAIPTPQEFFNKISTHRLGVQARLKSLRMFTVVCAIMRKYAEYVATLHAQRIAEKMVSERLREELIYYTEHEWSYNPEFCIEIVDEYLKTREK